MHPTDSAQEPLSAVSGAQTLTLPVSLSVTPAPVPGGSHSGTKVVASFATLTFTAAAGQNPEAQQVELVVGPITGPPPVFLRASVGPGGAWLVLPDSLSQPVPADGRVTLTLTLAVDRSRRGADEALSPLRTLLTITPIGADAADAALIEVLDVEPPPIVFGGNRVAGAQVPPPPGGTSFIVSSAVKASGSGGIFYTSDGWLRNLSGVDLPVDLYFTPDGKDGLLDVSLLESTRAVPGGATLRLADLVGSHFQVGSTSGQVEVRSSVPGSCRCAPRSTR